MARKIDSGGTKQLTGQTAINMLERCLILTELAEERKRDAQSAWFDYPDNGKTGCPDDYAHARSFGLTGEEGEGFLDWCANQRHFWLLCESGMDDYEASCEAQNDRGLLRGRMTKA
jgi:hypothetical protein